MGDSGSTVVNALARYENMVADRPFVPRIVNFDRNIAEACEPDLMTPLNLLDRVRLVFILAGRFPALMRRPHWHRTRLEAYQIHQMRRRLDEARSTVPLYRRKRLPPSDRIRQLSDWAALPLLTKDELLSAPESDHLSEAFRREDLIQSKSSGSTGKALDVYYDRDSFYLFVLAGLRLCWMAFPYRPWHRQTYIYTSPYPLDSLFGMYPMEFISTLAPIPEALEKLRARPPDLLICYPSHLRSLVDQMTLEDFERIRPRAVNVNSEMSSATERKYLGDKLHTFVFDDYSSEELTRIASQCRHLNYHVFEDINYIEIVDDRGQLVPEGTVGHIVGTNLHNRAMPLLRYLQGDRGAIRSADCPCGRSFRILAKLEGRKNDAFALPGGDHVSSGFLLDLTYSVFLDFDGAVSSFCLIQDVLETWTLEMVRGSRWSPDLERIIPARLEQKLNRPGIRIVPKLVDQVTRTASGKANPIISRIAKSAGA
jgi:phenylacetate-CoA ligase